MSLRDISAQGLADECESRAPSALCGDAAGLCAALALSLGGGARQPKLTTLSFGEKPAPAEAAEDGAVELRAKIFELADADGEAENNVLLAYRRPAMLPGSREIKAEKLREALKSACGVTLNLMTAVGEAARLIAGGAEDESDLVKAGASAGLALCAGALRALEAEACVRAARLSDAETACKIVRSAQIYAERYIAQAEKTQRGLAQELREAGQRGLDGSGN